ncbi:MAG: undecaprenyl-diphosphate phosphatase [Phycisphaerales bacterium]|nr:MAG: undecaprenyl-diphosphate phosphatase [Phycisphaerales bacterium]
MPLDLPKAVILGILQALTEFLPVSSSGHLALMQHWLKLDPDSPEMLLFDVCVHLGTLVAVILVFLRPIREFVKTLVSELRGERVGRPFAVQLAFIAILASAGTAAIGLPFQHQFERMFARPRVVAACLVVTGLLLITTAVAPRGRRGWRRFTMWGGLAVGLAQGLAILPGISRSGSTICVATFVGLKRRWAAQFSFLIAAPAIAGAAVLKIRDASQLAPSELATISWTAIAAGTLISVALGYVALKLLLAVVRRARLHYFAWYCWALAAAVLFFG